jgi:hypothetical protein
MAGFPDMRGVQEAYSLKQALAQADDRLFGSSAEGGLSGGGGSLNVDRLMPILANSGRGAFRNAAKGMQPVLRRGDAQPGTIVEYKNESGESEYGRIANVGEAKNGDEGVILNAISADEAARLIKNDPTIKQINLSPTNTVQLPPYKYMEPKKDFIDILFAPMDWLIMTFQDGALGKFSETMTSRKALNIYIIIGVIICVAFVAYSFYIVAK